VSLTKYDSQALLNASSLISDMRASGVKPIAIWDKRGAREWKAEAVSQTSPFLVSNIAKCRSGA
jgi:hypothetical protein